MDYPPPLQAEAPLLAASDPREALLEHGYAYLPGLLDREQVLDVRRQLLECAAAGQWLAPGSDAAEALSGPRAHDERDRADYLAVYGPVQRREAFHELGQSPRLLEVIEQVLDEPAFCLPFKIARFAFPGNDLGPTAAHQDYYYVQGSVDTVTAWIPLGSVASGEGRLAVLAGSHRLGPLPPIPQPNSGGGFWIDTRKLGLQWHGGDYQPGDVLLFHSMTVHGAEENLSPRVRLSMDVRFQPVADPICDASMTPHLRAASWEQIYEGWQDPALQYYWRDLPLQVVPSDSDAGRLVERSGSRLLRGHALAD